MQKKPKRKAGTAEFVAPFPLKACVDRLRTKARTMRKLSRAPYTLDVHAVPISADSVIVDIDMYVEAGDDSYTSRAVILLQRLDDRSTLVSFDEDRTASHKSKAGQGTSIASALPIVLMIVGAVMALLIFVKYPVFLIVAIIVGAVVYVFDIHFPTIAASMSSHKPREAVRRLIRDLLSDPFPGLPDFGGPVSAIQVGADGELVPIPSEHADEEPSTDEPDESSS